MSATAYFRDFCDTIQRLSTKDLRAKLRSYRKGLSNGIIDELLIMVIETELSTRKGGK